MLGVLVGGHDIIWAWSRQKCSVCLPQSQSCSFTHVMALTFVQNEWFDLGGEGAMAVFLAKWF